MVDCGQKKPQNLQFYNHDKRCKICSLLWLLSNWPRLVGNILSKFDAPNVFFGPYHRNLHPRGGRFGIQHWVILSGRSGQQLYPFFKNVGCYALHCAGFVRCFCGFRLGSTRPHSAGNCRFLGSYLDVVGAARIRTVSKQKCANLPRFK